MTRTNTLPPHLKAFRVDLRCSGKSMKSQLRSAEREHWLKPITVQRALRVRSQRHACNQRKVALEIRVGVLNVQGMSWTKRSYRGICHEWMSEGNKVVMGTLRVHAVCEWYGRYCVVSLFCETVAKFRIGDAYSRKQEVDWSHSSHWCFSVSSPLSLHANAERRECAWTETRALGTWNRAVVEVETKRRPPDPGR